MKLEVIKKCCTLYRFDENREIPGNIYKSDFFSVTKTDQELSVICDSDVDFACCTRGNDLRLFRVDGSLNFDLTGIISSITDCLAKKNIPLLAVSTFETVYIMVNKDVFHKAVDAFIGDNYEVIYGK